MPYNNLKLDINIFKMRLKEIKCLLCDHSDSSLIIDRNFPKHHICKNCGFVYMNPIIEFDENINFYENEYWEERGSEEKIQTLKEISSNPRTVALGEWVYQYLNAESNVLEIGAGYGYHLIYLNNIIGCKVSAIEPSKKGVQYLKSKGFEAHQTTLEKFRADQKFNLVVLSHVLEHFEDPQRALAIVHTLLKENGLLWIEVPNILYPNPRKNLNNWFAKEHISYFSINKLSLLLEKESFEIIKYEEDTYVRIMAKKLVKPILKTSAVNEYNKVKKRLRKHNLLYKSRQLINLPNRIIKKIIGR